MGGRGSGQKKKNTWFPKVLCTNNFHAFELSVLHVWKSVLGVELFCTSNINGIAIADSLVHPLMFFMIYWMLGYKVCFFVTIFPKTPFLITPLYLIHSCFLPMLFSDIEPDTCGETKILNSWDPKFYKMYMKLLWLQLILFTIWSSSCCFGKDLC